MSHDHADDIRRFYEAHRLELYAYALSITRNREGAEDALHGAFASVLRQGKRPRELRPYMFRVVRNAALDLVRDDVRRNGKPLFLAEPAHEPRLALVLEDALYGLNDDERETVVLKIYGRLTLREIAESRQVSINTVGSWYRRGIDKLREIFEETPNE